MYFIYLRFAFYFIEVSCETYQSSGPCQGFQLIFDHPVQIALNTSVGIPATERTAATFYGILTSGFLPVHKHCLNVLLPFICRWVFPTCDPGYNVSVEQFTCRRTCEILTNFVCNEVWLAIILQLENLNFGGVGVPVCDTLERANGGGVPDCIDTLEGGE